MNKEMFSPGSRLGQYRIIRKIGSGGTGEVYLCQHVVLEKNYAVKILNVSPGSAGIEMRGRMLREARIARSIRHRNLVSVIDANVVSESGAAYIVMEYIDGETLDELISGSPLPESAALYVCRCVALVLAEAEKHAIVHRDIKPANIMIDRAGNVKVTDLGIAKTGKASIRYDEPVTRDDKLLGTPDYASPEQLRDSSNVDSRADIYSLGATLYHMLSGHKPFEASGVFNLMAQVLESEPQDISGISPATALLVKKMMAKDPAARPQNMKELLSELRSTIKSNEQQISEVKRFLANGARRILTDANLRLLAIFRNAFIIICAIFSGVMILLHIFYQYDLDDKQDAKGEQIITFLQKNEDAKLLSALEKKEITPENIIRAVAQSNDIKLFRKTSALIPDLTGNKKYASLWLDLLSDEKHRKLLKLLLKTDFDVNAAKAQNRYPAVFRRELFRDVELLRMLVVRGLDVNAKDDSGRTALTAMARSRKARKECASVMLKAGIDINARDKKNRNAFNAAVNSGNPEFARFLLNAGIKLTGEDILNIPDVLNIKSELLAAERKKKSKKTAAKTAVNAKKQSGHESLSVKKESVRQPENSQAQTVRKASEDFLKESAQEYKKTEHLAAKRKLLAEKYDAAESSKMRRKIEVYLQTSPVKRLALEGEKEFVQSFIQQLERGVISPDITTGKQHVHLLESAANGMIYPRRKLFKALLDAGADPDSVPIPHHDIELCSMLLDYGRTKFAKDDLIKLLSTASPNWKCARQMLLRGADPAVRSKDKKENAFHRAAALGNSDFLKLLLDSGKPGADLPDAAGHTPFQRAVMCGKNETAKLLEESGYAVKVTSAMRNTGALFRAVENNDPGETAFRLLLDADAQQLNGKYLNVLQCAVENNSFEAVQTLLEHGISPNEYSGIPPVLAALKNGNDELFALLVSHGADLQTVVTDRFGRKSLLFTAVFNYMNNSPEKLYNCFQVMLENHWEWQKKTPDGDTPLSWMEKWNEGYPEIRQLFLSEQ